MSGSVAFEFGRSSAKRKLAVHEKDDDFQVEYLKEVDHEAFNEQTASKEIKPIPLQPNTSAYFKRHKPSRYLPTSLENQVSNEEKFEKPILDEQYNQKGDKKEEKLGGYGLQIRRPKNSSNLNGSTNLNNFQQQQLNDKLEKNEKIKSSNDGFVNSKQFDPYSNFSNQTQNSQMIDKIIEEKLKDDLRVLPAAPDEQNYQNVAVEDFGRAMLMGMGWNPSLEKNQNQVIVPDKRPDRLGLGAKAEDLQKKLEKKQKQEDKNSKDATNNQSEKDQSQKQSSESRPKEKQSISPKKDDLQNSKNIQKTSISKQINHNNNNNHFKTIDKQFSSSPTQTKQAQPNWLYNGIRVKILDKSNYEKYYLSKGVVSDVFEAGICDVHIESNGQIVQNVKQQYLETVVPRSKGAKVLIVRGQYKGQIGEFLKRDDTQQIVAVMLDDIMQVVKFGYDDVAEFVGVGCV